MVCRYKQSPSVKTFTDGTSTERSCLSVKVFTDGLSVGITAYNDGPSVAVAVLWCSARTCFLSFSLFNVYHRLLLHGANNNQVGLNPKEMPRRGA